MQRSASATAEEARGEAKKRQVALGVGLLFLFLALGTAGFLIYWFLFGEGKKDGEGDPCGTDKGACTLSVKANQRLLYKCELGKCAPQAVDKDNSDIAHNLANNIWFDNDKCRGPNWKEGDVTPCQGKFKCAPPPPSLLKTGASAKGQTLQGSLCQHVPDSQVATECGVDGSLCSNSDICQERCVAQYFTCPTQSNIEQTQCMRATPQALNSATTDIMIKENCFMLCSACFKRTHTAACKNGGTCLPTGVCECEVAWAGVSCADLRFGQAYATDASCSGNNCADQIVNACGKYAFPAFTCEATAFEGSKTKSATCISVDNVTPGAPAGSVNTAITGSFSGGNSRVTPNQGQNFGCNGVPGAVCRLDGFEGADENNSCKKEGDSVRCSSLQCTSDSDCKNVCAGDGSDGKCKTFDGRSMCTCPQNQDGTTQWNICGSAVAVGSGVASLESS